MSATLVSVLSVAGLFGIMFRQFLLLTHKNGKANAFVFVDVVMVGMYGNMWKILKDRELRQI